MFREGLRFSKEKEAFKAVYAIREIFQKGSGSQEIYDTRGMACAVEVNGSVRLVTWYGVINENDRNRSIIMDRFCSKEMGKHRLESSTIKENGSFSFVSVEGGGDRNPSGSEKLSIIQHDLLVPGEERQDFEAYSFTGTETLKIRLKYDVNKNKRELGITGPSKKYILEKTSVLGSPIIVKNKGKYSVVGVIGLSDGQLNPCFITKEVLDQVSSPKEDNDSRNDSFPRDGNSSTDTDVRDAPVRLKEERPPREKLSKNIVTGSFEESSERIRPGAVPVQWLPYLALDVLAEGRWKALGQTLGLEPGKITGIERDNTEEYERCYKMFETWSQRNAIAAFKDLAAALKKCELYNIRENYCLLDHDPPTQKLIVEVANLKKGVVTDEDLRMIADAVKVKRKRLGRALGLRDNDLDEIVEAYPGDIAEQSYKILRKWRQSSSQSDANYYAIAQALCDRTVDMKSVVSNVCHLPAVAKKRN